MPKKIKYILHPGEVYSITDKDSHLIGAKKLARLYGVNYRECTIFMAMKPGDDYPVGAIDLRPRLDGNYRKPDGSPNAD